MTKLVACLTLCLAACGGNALVDIDIKRDRVSAWLFARDNAALIAQLINSASPKQTAALLRHLAKYADDFSALAAERARAGAG